MANGARPAPPANRLGPVGPMAARAGLSEMALLSNSNAVTATRKPGGKGAGGARGLRRGEVTAGVPVGRTIGCRTGPLVASDTALRYPSHWDPHVSYLECLPFVQSPGISTEPCPAPYPVLRTSTGHGPPHLALTPLRPLPCTPLSLPRSGLSPASDPHCLHPGTSLGSQGLLHHQSASRRQMQGPRTQR